MTAAINATESSQVDKQMREFHYNLKRFNTAMDAYEGRLANVQIAEVNKKKAEEAFIETDKWTQIIKSNATAADAELATAQEAFLALKALLR